MFARLGELKGRAIDIPAPAVSEVDDYRAVYAPDFKIPTFFIRHCGRNGLGIDEDTDRTGAGAQSGSGAASLELVRRRAGGLLGDDSRDTVIDSARGPRFSGAKVIKARLNRSDIPPPSYTGIQRRAWDLQRGRQLFHQLCVCSRRCVIGEEDGLAI